MIRLDCSLDGVQNLKMQFLKLHSISFYWFSIVELLTAEHYYDVGSGLKDRKERVEIDFKGMSFTIKE